MRHRLPRGPVFIDADAHVLEPNDLWAAFVAPAFRDRAPRFRQPGASASIADEARLVLLAQRAGVPVERARRNLAKGRFGLRWLTVDGAPVWEGISDAVWEAGREHTLRHYAEALVHGFDASSQVAAMDRMGAERAHLFPTAGLWVLGIDGMEPRLAVALANAYNAWLAAFCAEAPGRLHPVGLMALQSPERLVEQVRAARALGFRAVTVRPNPFGGRTLADPALEAFWQVCAASGIAVAVHEGTHARCVATGADRFETRFGRHACSHPMEQMMALLALIEGGVLERHPDLRVAFLEAGCGWLPYWLWRLDHLEWPRLRVEVEGRVCRPPSEYVRRQCWFGCEPTEPVLEQVVDLVGADRLLYGSDYPHMDHGPNVAPDLEALRTRLGAAGAERVLRQNPTAFYGVR